MYTDINDKYANKGIKEIVLEELIKVRRRDPKDGNISHDHHIRSLEMLGIKRYASITYTCDELQGLRLGGTQSSWSQSHHSK